MRPDCIRGVRVRVLVRVCCVYKHAWSEHIVRESVPHCLRYRTIKWEMCAMIVSEDKQAHLGQGTGEGGVRERLLRKCVCLKASSVRSAVCNYPRPRMWGCLCELPGVAIATVCVHPAKGVHRHVMRLLQVSVYSTVYTVWAYLCCTRI